MDRFSVDEIPYNEALRTPVVDQMVRHSSVRSFDTSRPLPEGLVTALVAAGQSASTSSNMQSWSVVEVRDPERKHQLAEFTGNHEFLEQAPLILVFCADTYRLRLITEQRGWPFNCDYLDQLLIGAIDSALACQNVLLAAESMGLGGCMMGTIRNRPKEVSDLLELPHGVFATIGLALGWPKNRKPVKPRIPQSSVLHHERYSTATLERDLAHYDQQMARTDVYSARRVQVPGITPPPEQDTAFYGWTEHSARRMAAGNPLRRGLGAFVKSKGFMLE